MATNFMGLNLPTVSTTIGPDWASNLNVAIESIDSHDHTSGKGTKVPAAGLNINTDLNFNNIKAYDLFSTQFTSQPSTLTGATNALSLHVSGGNLYYTNSAGTAVQITSAGAVVSSPNAIQSYELQSVTGNITILAAATPSFFLVDTTASRTITLPLAINVASGRVYKFKDIETLQY